MVEIQLYKCSKCGKLVSKVYLIGLFRFCYSCAVEKGYKGIDNEWG